VIIYSGTLKHLIFFLGKPLFGALNKARAASIISNAISADAFQYYQVHDKGYRSS
jgi:hypothetical protein